MSANVVDLVVLGFMLLGMLFMLFVMLVIWAGTKADKNGGYRK